jgi:hypothetical protein
VPSRRERAAARIDFFVQRGALARAPSAWQVRVGWLVGLPVYLSESERERRASRRTWLGQVPVRAPLQVLYSPRHLLLATGLSLPSRAIVRHLVSVYHEDAFLGYDLQLLHSAPGGLDLLEAEATRVVTGANRLAPVLRRLVGGDGYHARLVAHAAAARDSVYPDPLDIDPRFASLVGFLQFCGDLPDWPARGFYGFDRVGRLR